MAVRNERDVTWLSGNSIARAVGLWGGWRSRTRALMNTEPGTIGSVAFAGVRISTSLRPSQSRHGVSSTSGLGFGYINLKTIERKSTTHSAQVRSGHFRNDRRRTSIPLAL